MKKTTIKKTSAKKPLASLSKPRFVTKMHNGKKMTIIDFGVPDAGTPQAVRRAIEFAKKVNAD